MADKVRVIAGLILNANVVDTQEASMHLMLERVVPAALVGKEGFIVSNITFHRDGVQGLNKTNAVDDSHYKIVMRHNVTYQEFVLCIDKSATCGVIFGLEEADDVESAPSR